MKKNSFNELQIYQIYPFGFFDAYEKKEHNHLIKLIELIPHLKEMHINCIYIGPLFESEYHGYDTIDYYQVDRRLGTNEDFKLFVDYCHQNHIKVIVDTVFNHVGRSFFAFKDLQKHRENSMYREWFCDVDFSKNNPHNDGFDYQTWDGHYKLVKLNLQNKQIKEYLLEVTKYWIDTFNIDGLRLDAANVMDIGFLKELSAYSKSISDEFFIVGEKVHGDYNQLLIDGQLDAVTNYECYKGLYSSLNDSNYFEIEYAIRRQFGEEGIYKNKLLYNFVDNHDVNRVASVLKKYEYLYPLYLMLYTMPGIPSVYYGSEFGAKGLRSHTSDHEIRKPFNRIERDRQLFNVIKRLSGIRKDSEALCYGDYETLHIQHKEIVYSRKYNQKEVICGINADKQAKSISINRAGRYYDLLNNEEIYINKELILNPYWGRILIAH